MTSIKHPHLLRRALVSNASDAAGYQLYDTIIAIIVVTSLGFSATQVGLLNALGSLPFLLLAVPIGIIVDSWGASRIIVVSLLVKVAATGATFALYATGLLETITTFMLVTIIGITTLASENAQTALVPRIATGKREITSFVSSMAAADRIAGIIAPALAGILAAASGSAYALGLAVALLGISAIAAVRLLAIPRAVEAPEATDSQSGEKRIAKPPLRTQLNHGFVILKNDRFLLGTTLLVAAGNIGLAMGDSLEPILVLRELDLGKIYFGLLGTLAAFSGILATVIAPRVTSRITTRRLFVIGAIVQSGVATLPLVSLMVPPVAYFTMGAFSVLWSITLTITNIAGTTYAAQAVREESLGRAAAARRMITMGSVPLAALGAGALADTVGLAVPLLVWPTLTIVAAIMFLAMTSKRSETSPEVDPASPSRTPL
ncbi:MFS transporter [Brachybacterium sp. YJGR34]|uniref:MFS transporter n=1 Tax=Brachybacterium sp. YJGR34 TaxID=2059911 RepID=UPI001300BDDA|nr:MFS transporter [Brachybacterium sp. YJGR34]